ncbi:MAG: SRPBCC family protein [Chitinophagaceae bacterium]|nr:SRPBCC family protein [Chitinophagaceae bacterium]
MAIHCIKMVQKIPVALDVAWNFFSNPANLERITEEGVGFSIVSKHHSDKIYPGQIIEYRIKPFAGISLYWMTEITNVVDRQLFVDEQRFGPFDMWHHQHHFKEVGGGVEMTDIVHYKIPFWVVGELANVVFVKNKLRGIFEYRKNMIGEIFR